jgi:hypothetical protein
VSKRADAKKVMQDRIYFQNDPVLLRKRVDECVATGKGLVVAHYNTLEDPRLHRARLIISPRMVIWITPMKQRDFHKWLHACLKELKKTQRDCGLCRIKPEDLPDGNPYSKGYIPAGVEIS